MENWQKTVVEHLAQQHEKWCRMGDVYLLVADAIPMHRSLRILATRKRYFANRADVSVGDIHATDLDLANGQWLIFTRFVRLSVEHQGDTYRWKPSDHIRLKKRPCTDCGKPTYPSWDTGHRVYSCTQCSPTIKG